ncbi:MAG: hypothetical protein LUC50_05625 [Ruminococcus sp.]|nr:hypothetical protein [Ruminococcus sp.]
MLRSQYGHNMSDLRGGSGAVGRGSGLPVPMMQYMGKCSGKLGASDFSTLLCKVYEQGYDYRYGKALSALIVINDMLTRIVWATKHYSKTGSVKDSILMCFPAKSKEHYDLSNMLLMSNAAFLAFDTGHAALKSHGDPITFLCNCNFKEWFNFAIAFSLDHLLTAKRAHDVMNRPQKVR